MLPKKERLSREAFNRFFSAGKRINTTSFQVVYAVNPNFHASVVVSKKIARLAVERNRIRRQIYDMVRRYKKEHMELHGVYIFIVQKGIHTIKSTTSLKEIVWETLQRIQTTTSNT
jgi:ribonuclease P protein component